MTHQLREIPCWMLARIVSLHVHEVSVFGKKSDAACGFLAYFCTVLRFSDPPYAPLQLLESWDWTASVVQTYM